MIDPHYAHGLPTEADLLALLPSDLGGLTVLGHLQRMAEDAARYRALADRLGHQVTRHRAMSVEDYWAVHFDRHGTFVADVDKFRK